MPDALLELADVTKNFGGLQAVKGCSFTIRKGSITGIIGPNGAGKTTTLNMIAGELSPDAGRIRLAGEEIAGKRSYQLSRLGVARTFQLARELGRLTVMENVCLAPHGQKGESLFWSIVQGPTVRRQEVETHARAREVLKTFNLYDKRNDLAATLSGGQKKLLEIARAMMADPTLLLMDEPTAGVNPALRDRLLDHIRQIHGQGLTVLIVEHNLSVIEQLCDDVIVMAAGSVLKRGTLAELRKDSDVVAAYLGGQHVNA
jgi:neutral amino acid transport system ATP-binding protein